MYKKYCKDDGPAGELTAIDYDVRGEANRQRDFLTAKANELRKHVNQSVSSYKKDEAERIKENEKIIKYVGRAPWDITLISTGSWCRSERKPGCKSRTRKSRVSKSPWRLHVGHS